MAEGVINNTNDGGKGDDNKGIPLLRTVVPTEFHDRAYLKELLDKPHNNETLSEVFKKLDGAQVLIGKKRGIPGEDATDEERTAFYGDLGLKDAASYEIQLGEASGKDEKFIEVIRKAMFDGKLSKAQAKGFQDSLRPALEERQAAAVESGKALEVKFEKLVEEGMGKDNEAAMARAQEAMKAFTPKAYQPYIQNLPNEQLVVLAAVIDAVLQKYVPEDQLKHMSDGGGSGSGSKEEMLAEARRLMGTKEYRDGMHIKHEETVKKVRDLFEAGCQ